MKLCLIITSFAALINTVNSMDGVKSTCSSGINGYTFKNWTGIIQSPNFERGTYENNERCEWRIRLSAGSRVRLTFRHFELEEPQSANAKKCWDYIELLDGPENQRTFLTKKCGRSQPETVMSKTNEVALNFFSDNSKVYKGFEIEYIGVCENTITELKALIESPGYPELPPPGVVCKWTLKGDEDNRPAVEVKSIKHYFKICSHSGLKITDLPHQDRTDYLCKNHSGLKFSGGPALQITYDPREATRITKFVLNVSHVGSNPCEVSPCLNEGNCLDLGNNFNCLCRPGFSGAKCESDIYECESNPCQNNGVCRDFINGFMCACPYGYTGSTCETPINTCRGISCLNGGKCVADSEDTYHCVCLGGYTGPSCENRTDGVIPGQTCKMIKCQNGGSCLPYKEGGFVCKCPAGVMGPYCEVVTGKECDKNPCSADATCVATTNDDDEISEHNPGFKCLCPEGRIGQFCENYVDHCLINECHNGASCSSVANTFYCSCTSGWKGRLCEHDIDECLDNPCENGGRCENAYGTYSCDCKKGFTGYNCSTNLNDCTVNSCQNGGTCIDRINGYACKCPFTFWGKKCQHKRYPCDHKPCKNGGICVSYKASFYCECKQGFTGKTCSDLLDPCNPQPCQNNGKCVYEPAKGDLKCVCPPGILGTLCELRNECFSSPCLNGGRCLEQLGKYVCKCAPGFYGKHCQIKKTTCTPNPCTHGGRCIQLTNSFQCQCTKNYDGQTCSHFKYTDTLHCPEEVDTINGSGILWFGTQVGHHDIQPCPPGVLGNATRQCFEDNSVPDVRATWGRPDLSNCVHKKFLDIKKKAEQLLLSERVTSQNINDVSNTIFDIVENKSDQKLQLYPGDLGVAVDTFGIMADVVGEASDDDVDMQPTIEAFGKTVGSVIDQSVVPVWRNANPNMVGEKMASVLANTERMASNVFQHGHRGSTQSYSMASTNLDFSISTVEDVYTGDKLKRSETSSIRLPDEVYDICRRENKGRPVGLFNARFTSIGQILSFKQDRPNSLNDTRVINSDVITSSVVGVARSKFQRLSSPIILVFQLKDENLRSSFNESCVFMNMNATNRFDRWHYKGCYLAKKTAGYTECHCYHMTNFALLMDVHGIGEKIDDRHQIALSFISYIGGALSILGCVLSVFAFEYFRLSSDRVRIHENLAVSIILVQLVFLIGIDRKDSPVACKVVAILLHYVMMAMFCWMLVEGIHLYIVLVKVFKTGSHLKKYAAIGWGVPLVIVGIPVALAFDNYGQGNICWMTSSSLLVLFVPTVALVIVLNTIVLAIVIRVMLRSFRSSHRAIAEETSAVRVGLKATAVLLPLLGLTWTFGFLSVDSSSTLVFTYIFTILNCLQGLFFFIFHCLMNIDVRNAIKRKYFGRKRSTMSAGRKSSVDFETYGEFSSGGKKLVRDSSTSVATNTTDLCSFERKRATLSEKHPNLLNKSTNCNGEVSRNGSVSGKNLKVATPTSPSSPPAPQASSPPASSNDHHQHQCDDINVKEGHMENGTETRLHCSKSFPPGKNKISSYADDNSGPATLVASGCFDATDTSSLMAAAAAEEDNERAEEVEQGYTGSDGGGVGGGGGTSSDGSCVNDGHGGGGGACDGGGGGGGRTPDECGDPESFSDDSTPLTKTTNAFDISMTDDGSSYGDETEYLREREREREREQQQKLDVDEVEKQLKLEQQQLQQDEEEEEENLNDILSDMDSMLENSRK